MAISAEEGTHVSELMRRTRRFLDGVEAEEAARERERQERLRRAFAEEAEDEGGLTTLRPSVLLIYRSYSSLVHPNGGSMIAVAKTSGER